MAVNVAPALDDAMPEAPASVQRGEHDSISRMLGFAATIALLIAGTATFLILIGLAPIAPSKTVVNTALAINTVLALVVLFLIGREVAVILSARRKGRAAARLHVRIIGLFALVAAIPAILVAGVASVTLDVGLDRWFEIRTKRIVSSSVSVAQAYMDESRRVLTGNTISMASDLDRARQIYSLDRGGFQNLMNLQAKARGFMLAELLHRDGTVIVAAERQTEEKLPRPVEDVFVAADTGDPVGIPPGSTNLIGAMFKLREIPNAYLYTIVSIRPEVIQQLRVVDANTTEYAGLEANRLPVQLAFAVLYIGVCLIVLLAAIWMGISVADRFVSPIRRLITAADAVSAGNLDIRVGTKHTEGDLKSLSDTFNVMISEIRNQRNELVRARDDISQRARFTEAVLSGVSAAVIGIDGNDRITIANLAAGALLGGKATPGVPLAASFPELAAVVKRARASARDDWQEQIATTRGGVERTLSVGCTLERRDEGVVDGAEAAGHSLVITVDDITNLVAAQRNTAWSDVARRIAHEIKNPLTPIQLSAERIRRRYGKFITEDREVFDQCTDTIIRQVGDIGRMVDEFSSFARMPKPQLERHNVVETLNEAVFLQKVALPEIEFVTDFGNAPLFAKIDSRLFSQAVINLIKNAAEAISAAPSSKNRKGRIEVSASSDDDNVIMEVSDNGKGWPAENRHRLLEPYVTTREKGTGLGLAIVRKIVEDHHGWLELRDPARKNGDGRGATVRIILPRADEVSPNNADNSAQGETAAAVEGSGV